MSPIDYPCQDLSDMTVLEISGYRVADNLLVFAARTIERLYGIKSTRPNDPVLVGRLAYL